MHNQQLKKLNRLSYEKSLNYIIEFCWICNDLFINASSPTLLNIPPDISKLIIMTVKIVEATIPIVEKIFFSFLLEIIAYINAIISNINAIIIPKFEYSIHPIINNKIEIIPNILYLLTLFIPPFC